MKIIVLSQDATVDGVQRKKGQVVNAPDEIDPKLIKKTLKKVYRPDRKPKKVKDDAK